MKSTFFPVAAIVAGVVAQDLGSLPQCGQTCVNNLLALGPELGCTEATAECLCSSANFAWGIHDCSTQSCPAGTDLAAIDRYGLEYCQSAQATATGTTFAAIGIFSSVVSTASAVTTTTAPIVSTITSDGTTRVTTIGSITSTSTNSSSIASGSSTATTTNTSSSSSSSSGSTSRSVTTVPVVTTITSDGTTRETTIGSTESVETSSSSAGAARGRPMAFSGPAAVLTGALDQPALAVAQVLGLGVVGIAGVFWGAGIAQAI